LFKELSVSVVSSLIKRAQHYEGGKTLHFGPHLNFPELKVWDKYLEKVPICYYSGFLCFGL
jgi:hypothetical protein